MGCRVRIRLFHILHFVMHFLFPLLKNSKSGVDDRGHRLRSRSPVTNLPGAPTAGSLSYSFQELNKSMVDNYLKPVFLQTPGNDLRLIGQ